MSTPVPAAPPPPPNRAFRMPVRRRPAPSVPLEAAEAASGSRCVTRDPEASSPRRCRRSFWPAWPGSEPPFGFPLPKHLEPFAAILDTHWRLSGRRGMP